MTSVCAAEIVQGWRARVTLSIQSCREKRTTSGAFVCNHSSLQRIVKMMCFHHVADQSLLVIKLNWHRLSLSETKEHLKEQSDSFSTWSRRCADCHTEHFVSNGSLIRSSPRSMSRSRVRHFSSITNFLMFPCQSWMKSLSLPVSIPFRDRRSALAAAPKDEHSEKESISHCQNIRPRCSYQRVHLLRL